MGFTIPEVLAVVAILTIVLSIMLPNLSRVKAYMQRTMCATNQHNWGVGLRAYAADNRGFFPDNRYAVPPGSYQSYTPGFHISWNSSVVQKFWKQYLAPLDSAARTNEHDVLNCPTQTWHQVNDINLAGGLVGYFYMPGRGPDGQSDYSLAGDGWVYKNRFGGPDSRAPIMSDMKQYSLSSGWFFNGGAYGRIDSAISSHVRATGEPEGGNFLFEDAHVSWYDSDRGGDPNPSDPNDIIQRSGSVGGWWYYYKIPLD